MNKNDKLQNYIDFQNKFKRMNDLLPEWQVEYSIEKFKPLIDDGFDGNDIIEYFTVKLIDYIDNKYEPTKVEDTTPYQERIKKIANGGK
jgi:hypothetical protein